MSELLTLHTEETAHQLPCEEGAALTIGADAACDIPLDGAGIEARHLRLRRLRGRRFHLVSLAVGRRVVVNGVAASDLEVDAPFRLTLGGDVIDFSLAVPAEAAAPAAQQVQRRRDYLLGPVRLRQRLAQPVSMPEPEPAPAVPPPGELVLTSPAPKIPPAAPPPPPPPFNHVRTVRGPSLPPLEPATEPERRLFPWVLATILGLLLPPGVYFGFVLFNQWSAPVTVKATSMPPPISPPKVVIEKKEKPAPPPAPPPDTYREDALAAAKSYLNSWGEADASTVLKFVSPAPASYFEMPNPASEAVLRLEEEFRARWPQRVIRADGDPTASRDGESRFEVTQRFLFDLHGMNNRHASGAGTLFVTVERVAPKTWLVIKAADKIEPRVMEPSREAFSPAQSLRELKPALNAEELKQQAAESLSALVKSGAWKAALAAILDNAAKHPQDTFWRFATDQVCDALSCTLFAEGVWQDASCAEEVQKLSALGVTSAMLLHGHLLRAGYALPRNVAEGEALYRKAYEATKGREARFYYAEALFIGGETERAAGIALATMTSSKHPLEAYLAAHLLWKKAELDSTLWQQVYETAARAATQHPPAKNLAGLVLLKHGQTTKERQAGFVLIEKAAEEGVVEAMKNLSACYEYGDGCRRDPKEAEKWQTRSTTSKPLPKRHYSEFEG